MKPLIPLRWCCLGVFLVGLAGCGPTDMSKDPANVAAAQKRADRIEELKKKTKKPAPARRPG